MGDFTLLSTQGALRLYQHGAERLGCYAIFAEVDGVEYDVFYGQCSLQEAREELGRQAANPHLFV